jgi:hypothetical protein
MVQIFQQAPVERDPLLDNLVMNLPGAIENFQQQRQQTKAMGDLAEQLGLFEAKTGGGTVLSEEGEVVQQPDLIGQQPGSKGLGGGIDRKTFDSLPPEARQSLIQQGMQQKQQQQQEIVNAQRTRAYERASGLPEGTFEGLDDQGAQKLALEFVKARQAGQKLPDDVKNYLVESQKSFSEAEGLAPVIDRLKVLNEQGAADPLQISNGLANIPGFGWMKNPDSVEFDSGASLLIERFKNAIGGRITQVEFESFKEKLPQVGKSREANRQLLDILSKGSEIAKKRQELIRNIRKENGGIAPADTDIRVEEALEKDQSQFRQQLNSFGGSQSSEQPQLQAVPEGKTRVRLKDGRIGLIPNNQLEAFKAQYEVEVMQ